MLGNGFGSTFKCISRREAEGQILLCGDVDQDEAIVAEVTSDLDGVAPIGLAMFTRTTRNQRWGGHVAFDAPLGERALEHVASTRGLMAGTDAALGEESLEVAANLARIVGQPVHPHGLGITVAKDGGGNGILVDVQADPEVDG